MNKRFLDVDVRIRALTDAEVDACRTEAGEMPIYGQLIAERVGNRITEVLSKNDGRPEWMRQTHEAAHRAVVAQLVEHDEEAFDAYKRFLDWRGIVAEQMMNYGLQHPALEDLPEGVDRAEFIAIVSTAIDELTTGDEGKEPGPHSAPTSQPDAESSDGALAAKAAQTR